MSATLLTSKLIPSSICTDVISSIILRAFSTLAGFRGDCALGTWLARIAFHASIDAHRRRGRTVSLDDAFDEDPESAVEPTMAWIVSTVESPDSQAERGEVRAFLQDAIDSLKRAQAMRAEEESVRAQRQDRVQSSELK